MEQYAVLLSIITLSSLIMVQASEEKKFSMEFHKVDCIISNPRVIKRFECFYEKLGPSRYLSEAVFILNQQLDKTIESHIRIHIGTGGKIVKFLDMRVNVCDTLKAGISVPILRKIIALLMESSNFPRKCPLKANFLYNMSNLIVDDSFFPKYTPYPMVFNYTTDIYSNQKKIAIIHIEGALVAKKNK
ncbi:uncharacterized protein LOC106082663 [Stomoxys calcitrans]|uniref:uncharacterized protein LOC106082663 n=1 Tax=Stomoxys calcitrans TaxID=35570 RepID=UPI0027E2A51A|nr:uncharacterized protein LOC106082663 [Stomoxys calcitrans]